MTFENQPSKPDFWKLQEALTKYWKDNQTFEKSVEQRPASNPFRFYDGPPFITGLPHYGSLLSSICKDVIPRYQTMKGKRVERVRGWDCHGIPIEEKVQKTMNLSNKYDIEKAGIDKFIEGCYQYTNSNSAEWKRYVDASGRWVDFENAYKTMDNDYMESVWRAFKQIFDKKNMYEGKRVSLYSTKLSTPISNFEVAMDNTYDDVNDPAITVAFELLDTAGAIPSTQKTYILARTTTPWTIPANIALGVHTDIEYVKVFHHDNYYIVAKARVEDVFKGKGDYDIIDEFKGEFLIGLSYKPPFDYFYGTTGNAKDHTIVFADFATDENGTGIVHQAPEFGEDDFNLANKEKLTITEAMDDLGRYTDQINDLTGTFYRDANDIIMERLKDKGLLFNKAGITHRVAFCPRTGIPLVYKAQDSWFINIQDIKQKLLDENEKINWYPGHFKHGRFAHSLQTAPDWCISRTRYRGTPMPVYRAKDADGLFTKEETLVLGSREELFELNKDYKQLTKVILINPKSTQYNEQSIANQLASVHVDAVYVDSSTNNNSQNMMETMLNNKGLQVNDFSDYKKLVKEHAGQTIVIQTTQELFKVNPKSTQAKVAYVMVETGAELDLHRPYVDAILIKSPKTGRELYRIPEVLDCWFESASMPYAQEHYPFENKEKMEASFPADYIVEYTGQIRAWFYVMHVMGVLLFNKPSFTNVLCTGVMQGNDGRKMSKSYGNYPDPKDSFMKYGGDAIRMHSLHSPVVYGGDVAVKEEAFLEIAKKALNPLWNAFYFFTTYANIDGFSIDKADHRKENMLDQWIMSELHTLVATVDNALANYNMFAGAAPLLQFLDNLTNWYIRRSRRRFWKSENDGDKMQAYTTLYHVLVTFCQVAAPFMPFITEHIYRALTKEESVHLTLYPVSDKELINKKLSDTMSLVQDVIRIGLSWRSRHNIRVRQPLPSVTIGIQLDEYFTSIIADELNVKSVLVDTTINDTVTKICMPNGRLIGPKFGGDVKMIIAEAKAGNFVEHEDGSVSVAHFMLQPGEFEISYIKNDASLDIEVEKGIVVSIDGTVTPELELEGYTRDLVRIIQDSRKDAGYDIADRIKLSLSGDASFVANLVQQFGDYIQEETLSSLVEKMEKIDMEKEVDLGGKVVKVGIGR